MTDPPRYDGLPLRRARVLLADRLVEHGVDAREAEAISRLALESVTRYSPVEMVLHASEVLTDFEARHLGDITQRLLRDEPIQYILGETHWMGMKLRVTPDTLIPRPETQQLIDIIIEENPRPDLRVLDIGTGSGCIAIALARGLKFPIVTAIDFSPAALEVARGNASELRTRVTFSQADALGMSRLDGEPFDVIVSNPPYITWAERPGMERNVLEYEPQSALFVPDDDPLKFYRAIMRYAATGGAAHDGKIYFEINPLFVDSLRTLGREIFPEGRIEVARDMYGCERFMIIHC